MKEQLIQHQEIVKGVAITGASFGLMELNALLGAILASIGIAYTLRKWFLMEKHKKDASKPPFAKE